MAVYGQRNPAYERTDKAREELRKALHDNLDGSNIDAVMTALNRFVEAKLSEPRTY